MSRETSDLASTLFHNHLDGCRRCSDRPFDLCETGRRLLAAAAIGCDGFDDLVASLRKPFEEEKKTILTRRSEAVRIDPMMNERSYDIDPDGRCEPASLQQMEECGSCCGTGRIVEDDGSRRPCLDCTGEGRRPISRSPQGG